jgi:hypothetical protein
LTSSDSWATREDCPVSPHGASRIPTFVWDDSGNLSGSVAHGTGFPPTVLNRFGPPGKAVKLLDGFFLAVRSETLLSKGIRFDESFDFHFYDMDFCRQAEQHGLRMGTWTLSAIHESGGRLRDIRLAAGLPKILGQMEKLKTTSTKPQYQRQRRYGCRAAARRIALSAKPKRRGCCGLRGSSRTRARGILMPYDCWATRNCSSISRPKRF